MIEGIIKNYEHNKTKFGGIIYLSDFNTEYRKDNADGSLIAKRILDDLKFEEQCKNIYYKKGGKNDEKTNL